MSLRDAPELQPYILNSVEHTGKFLGRGSFGAVEEMRFDHAPCAGKIIHEILVDSRFIGCARLVEKFEQECKLLKELRHPHIVQFLGLCFFDDSNIPVIVMELLSSSIDQWLKSTKKELPLSLKSTILHDTANGLSYLHSHDPVIIHRDLTARNILLTSSMRAKIADLGNAYIVPPQHLIKTMTRVPGTIPYMPPEAFQPNTRYTIELDIFSYGHLALYVMVQDEPFENLLPPTYPDPRDPSKIIGRSEVERRSHYFDKLYEKFSHTHDLANMIRGCLNNDPTKRLSASEIINIFDNMLKEHIDEYQAFASLNRFDMAEKLKEAHTGQRDIITAKIENGEDFILGFHKFKQGKKKKGGIKWRKYIFCYKSQTLEGYGDMNKPPVHSLDSGKIEGVLRVNSTTFEIQHKGKESWCLRTSNEEETLAWMEILKPGSTEGERRCDLPLPPPPPLQNVNMDDDNVYEHVFDTHEPLGQIKKEEYTLIDPKSRNAPLLYNQPTVTKANQKDQQQDMSAVQSEQPSTLPQISIESEDGCQAEATSLSLVGEKIRRPKSRQFNEEQCELLMNMIPSQSSVKLTPRKKKVEFYDDIEYPPSVSQVETDGMGHENVDSSYVDVDEIEDSHLYEPIPGIPRNRSKSFYHNIDDKPPIPPKTPTRHAASMKSRKPPTLNTAASIVDVMNASATVSTDMLILDGNDDDNDDDDEGDTYETMPHRPAWAKASLTVSTNKELEKYELEDEMASLLSLDRKSIHSKKKCGSGQFGEVFRAIYSPSHGENIEVAVKSVKHDTEKEKKAFIKEMKIMSNMLHPNIVRLIGLVREENWIVLEYLFNGDLLTFLQKNSRSTQRLIMYMTDIAMGMHHIYGLGLIHRDLAARNVLVNQNEVCKVSDFGLIRQMDAGCYQFTGTSKIPIRWCAPEVLTKREYYPASDVWSYGIVLWEMINPTLYPFHQFEDYEVGARIKDGGRPDIPLVYPPTVQKIMLACFQRKPEKRPSFQYITTLLIRQRYMYQKT